MLAAALTREFISRTRYQIVAEPTDADAVLTGSVVNFFAYPTTFDPQTGRAAGVQVIVYLQLSLRDRSTNAVLFDRPHMEFRQTYEISVDAAKLLRRERCRHGPPEPRCGALRGERGPGELLMTPAQFLARIKRNEIAPAYLFLGAEAYQARRCREALLDRMLGAGGRENGLTQYDLDESSLAQVVDDARVPFAVCRAAGDSDLERRSRPAASEGRDDEDESGGSGDDGASAAGRVPEGSFAGRGAVVRGDAF